MTKSIDDIILLLHKKNHFNCFQILRNFLKVTFQKWTILETQCRSGNFLRYNLPPLLWFLSFLIFFKHMPEYLKGIRIFTSITDT